MAARRSRLAARQTNAEAIVSLSRESTEAVERRFVKVARLLLLEEATAAASSRLRESDGRPACSPPPDDARNGGVGIGRLPREVRNLS